MLNNIAMTQNNSTTVTPATVSTFDTNGDSATGQYVGHSYTSGLWQSRLDISSPQYLDYTPGHYYLRKIRNENLKIMGYRMFYAQLFMTVSIIQILFHSSINTKMRTLPGLTDNFPDGPLSSTVTLHLRGASICCGWHFISYFCEKVDIRLTELA